jgi:hypothetical protein
MKGERRLRFKPLDPPVLGSIGFFARNRIYQDAVYETFRAVVFRFSWKWRRRSPIKIMERTHEKATETLHAKTSAALDSDTRRSGDGPG